VPQLSSSSRDSWARLLCCAVSQTSTGFCWSWEWLGKELSKYLSDKSTDVTALNCYPLIRTLYIELNTGLLASAAVEGLFSLRSKLSSEHSEMMLFMRSVNLWTAAAVTLFSLQRRVISPLWFRLNIEGFDFFFCDKKYTGVTYVYVYVIKEYWSKSIGIGMGVTKHHTAPLCAPRRNTMIGFWLNKQETLRKRWIRPMGRTDEGAKRPVTCRSRLLVVRRAVRCVVTPVLVLPILSKTTLLVLVFRWITTIADPQNSWPKPVLY